MGSGVREVGRGRLPNGHPIRLCGKWGTGSAVGSCGWWVRVLGGCLASRAVSVGSGGAGGSAAAGAVGLLAAGGGAVHGESAGAGQGAG